ncbi:MAG: nucleotidyltransferase family protein [Deltaproteobacteria bacterium]|nr:nucleotidyltransferase family protein [Deltaproteobacteria bacterium]
MELKIDRELIGEVCRRHRIRRLAVFGSGARGELRPDSDVDLLIEFEPDVRVGFLGLGFIADELSKAAGGRSVDLVSPKALNARIRDRVLAEAKPLYG